MSREMDEYDREYMRELLDMTDEKTKDILNRTVKILDEEYNTIFYTQDVANMIEAFEKAKANAWKEKD